MYLQHLKQHPPFIFIFICGLRDPDRQATMYQLCHVLLETPGKVFHSILQFWVQLHPENKDIFNACWPTVDVKQCRMFTK